MLAGHNSSRHHVLYDRPVTRSKPKVLRRLSRICKVCDLLTAKHVTCGNHDFVLWDVSEPSTCRQCIMLLVRLPPTSQVSRYLVANIVDEWTPLLCTIVLWATMHVSWTSGTKRLNDRTMALTQLILAVLSHSKVKHQVVHTWTIDGAQYQRSIHKNPHPLPQVHHRDSTALVDSFEHQQQHLQWTMCILGYICKHQQQSLHVCLLLHRSF